MVRSSRAHKILSRAIPNEPIWPLRVEQYHAMLKSGILTADDPVELLQGWLVVKMPKNPAHRLTARLMRSMLEQIVPAGWYVDSQGPITLAQSEPEPDIIVVRGQAQDYVDHHPGASDLALVIEISDTTLERDQSLKKSLYARAGILRYWIVNLLSRQIEVYGDPVQDQGTEYEQWEIYSEADEIPIKVEEADLDHVPVRDLLP